MKPAEVTLCSLVKPETHSLLFAAFILVVFDYSYLLLLILKGWTLKWPLAATFWYPFLCLSGWWSISQTALPDALAQPIRSLLWRIKNARTAKVFCCTTVQLSVSIWDSLACLLVYLGARFCNLGCLFWQNLQKHLVYCSFKIILRFCRK